MDCSVDKCRMRAPTSYSAVACLLLLAHSSLLAYSATCHSPTYLEPAFLASGVCAFTSGRFDLYCVNPPLPRLCAAAPAVLFGCDSTCTIEPAADGRRLEFTVGRQFVARNSHRIQTLIEWGRWATIPFGTLAGYLVFRWGADLYGRPAGLLSLLLFVLEPNLLAHCELITPDSASISFGLLASYVFWRWLKSPTWALTAVAGIALGLAQLTRFTWIILFVIWPALWAFHGLASRHIALRESERRPTLGLLVFSCFGRLICMLLLGLVTLNVGYACRGSFERLESYTFYSNALTGAAPGVPGNRFAHSILAGLPVPVPHHYLAGCDLQWRDFEDFGDTPSFLMGEWKHGGWWHYYLYGLLVKLPVGLLFLLGLVLWVRTTRRHRVGRSCGEWILLLPPAAILAIASSQAEFATHLRYVYSCIPALIIFAGQVAMFTATRTWLRGALLLCILYDSWTLIDIYPHHLMHFNALAGGPQSGSYHLAGSSVDWGQNGLSLCSMVDSIKSKSFAREKPVVAVCANLDPLGFASQGDRACQVLTSTEFMESIRRQPLLASYLVLCSRSSATEVHQLLERRGVQVQIRELEQALPPSTIASICNDSRIVRFRQFVILSVESVPPAATETSSTSIGQPTNEY